MIAFDMFMPLVAPVSGAPVVQAVIEVGARLSERIAAKWDHPNVKIVGNSWLNRFALDDVAPSRIQQMVNHRFGSVR